ncbi:MAG: alpha/beta hydrolase family protein [Mycobacteriaceae bacterium]
MASRNVTSVNVDVAEMPGTVDLPRDAAELSPEEFRESGPPVAVFAHCFTCHRNVPAAFRISKSLAQAGLASLRFDFSSLVFSENIRDLRAAASWLSERLAPPTLLVGHSLGGAAVLRAARHLPDVRAVATVGAPFRPASAARTLVGTVDGLGGDGTTAHLAGRDVDITREFLGDLAELSHEDDIAADIAAVGAPLLVLHSPTDQTVPVTEAERVFGAAAWPKSLLSLQDADHLLTRRGSATRTGETIAAWAGPHLSAIG